MCKLLQTSHTQRHTVIKTHNTSNSALQPASTRRLWHVYRRVSPAAEVSAPKTAFAEGMAACGAALDAPASAKKKGHEPRSRAIHQAHS